MPRHPGGAALFCLMLTGALAACGEPPAPPPEEPRPVRVATVESRGEATVVSLTGTIQAQTEVNLGFRIDGRMVDRLVNVGDRVTAGQVVARLDRTNEENSLRAARASLTAAQAQLVESRANYGRARELLRTGRDRDGRKECGHERTPAGAGRKPGGSGHGRQEGRRRWTAQDSRREKSLNRASTVSMASRPIPAR